MPRTTCGNIDVNSPHCAFALAASSRPPQLGSSTYLQCRARNRRGHSSRRFGSRNVQFSTCIANQISIAIENARLYNQVQQKEEARGELLRPIVATLKEERQRITGRLHDETSPALTGLAVNLEAIIAALPLDIEQIQGKAEGRAASPGGCLSIQSRPGSGTRISVEIPVDGGPMSKIRVLIADDHAIMREGIRALLALHDDIEVAGEASDGRDTIAKVAELTPDVVLMDIAMPLMDGLEATRRIRKQSPSTKILILTQHDDKQHVLSSVKAGAVGCISKKAVAAELISAIGAVYRGDSFLYPSIARMLIDDYLLQTAGETDPHERLTDREREVLKLVAEGHTNRQIADLLVLSVKTILGHRTRIMGKLDIHNRTELVKYAIRKGLINIDD